MPSGGFDVFLSYNSRDRDAVLAVAEALRAAGLRVWIDDWELVPGRPWQGVLEELLETTPSVAICLGAGGLGAWQEPEMRAAIDQAVSRRLPVIPLILPTAVGTPDLPLFLRAFTWVDLRGGAGLERLIWGITGKKPGLPISRPPVFVREENPFTDIAGIRDPTRFVGRERSLSRVRSLLRSGSVSIVGPPKIGKSSLLWRIREGWNGDVVGPLDLQSIEDRADFYAQLGRELGLSRAGWPEVREVLKTRPLLLILDELDSGPARRLDTSDLARLRSAQSANPHLHLLTASRGPVKSAFPDGKDGSPGFNLLLPHEPGHLSEDEAKALLAHPWAPELPAFPETVVQEILADLASDGDSGHPCWLQRAGHHKWEAMAELGYDWRVEWRQERSHLV